ncbi:hypothetical protein [Amycolatopsis sp. NPDC051903]|uniref:hypothetical protein n=1 Tax=Amycolatopsis sp. NPDC051903 TaxID=3363936 RepID=UPI0037A25876
MLPVVAAMFTDEEPLGLWRFPEIGRQNLFPFFTLAPTDEAFVDPGRVTRADVAVSG